MYELNVEKLTKDQKTFVLQLWPLTNVRELTRAHDSGAWLKSRRAYNVRELSHAAWLNSSDEAFVIVAAFIIVAAFSLDLIVSIDWIFSLGWPLLLLQPFH